MRDKSAEKLVSKLVYLLQEERKRQGISYQKLAEIAGVHRTTISLMERQKLNPTVLLCKKLANALGVELSALVKKAEKA